MNDAQPTAQLWIGAPAPLAQTTITYIHQRFCTKHNCQNCTIYAQIAAKQFYGLLWLTPEKTYTIEQIEPIFERATLMLEKDQLFFFVIAHAECLNISCANKLLKIMEEPPTGYHFILLANRLHHILPTIRSRCHIVIHNAYTKYEHPLITFFSTHQTDPLSFMHILDTNTPTEQESIELIDALLAQQYQEALKNQHTSTNKTIALLQQALKRPPAPGGSKLFWRNLFMQWRHP